MGDLAAADRERGPTFQDAAQEGCVLRAAFEVIGAEFPFERGINDGDIGGAADREGTETGGIESAEFCGFEREEGDEARPVDCTARNKGFRVEGERRLETDETERGFLEGEGLFVGRVRGVIGSQDGDRAIGDAGAEHVDVALFAERGIDLAERVVTVADFVREVQVVGGGLTRHGDPRCASAADDVDRLAG